MVCHNCGSNIKKIMPTNLCPECGIQICPQCGSDDWDSELIPPADEKDTVGLVFGLKPYAKCRKCGNLFKDSMLIEAERKEKGLPVQTPEGFRRSRAAFRLGIAFSILGIIGATLSLILQLEQWVSHGYILFACVGIILIVYSKLTSIDK